MMTGKDDADSIREDSFLDDLYPQLTEYLAERYADGYDADARRARFLTWLVRHTEEPGTPAAAKVHARPHRTLPEASPDLSTSAGASPAPSAMRKMAVYLGLVEDDHQYADAYDSYEEYEDADLAYTFDEAAEYEDVAHTGQRSEQVPQTTGLTSIVTLHPRTYNEARTIGEHFREGTPVIMNLTEMVDSDAKRLVDFAAGLIFGLRGSIERVTNKVFLLSPANAEVTAEDKARIAERGFFNHG